MSRLSPQDRLDEPWDSSAVNAYFEGETPDFEHVTGVFGIDRNSSNFTDPHDFYRLPTSASRSNDLVVDNSMTSAARQRPSQPNGTRTIPRPGFRSASGPASSTPTFKSTTTLPSTNRQQVRNLVDRFNQPTVSSTAHSTKRYYRPARASLGSKPPALSTPSKSTSNPTSPVSLSQNDGEPNKLFKPKHKGQYPPAMGPSVTIGGLSGAKDQDLAATVLRSPHRQVHQHPVRPSRPALFGEIALSPDGMVDLSRAPTHPGEQQTWTDGSMHRPNAMFPRGGHSRTRSYQDASPITDLHDFHASGSGFAAHRKSRSEAYNFTQQPYVASTDVSPNRSRSPRSRIPVRSKRTSGHSESGSSTSSRTGSIVSESRYTSASPPKDSRLPTGPQSRAQAAKCNGRPKTPPTILMAKRYEGTPVSSPNGSSLKAVIHPSLPKLSPPLRTSRSRQPLPTVASTNRPKEPKSPVHAKKGSTGLGGANFAARRSLFESSSQESLKKRSIPLRKKKSGLSSAQQSPTIEVTPETVKAPARTEPAVSSVGIDLKVETIHLPVAANNTEPSSGNTNFEADESPVLGMPGQFPSNSPYMDSEAVTDEYDPAIPRAEGEDTEASRSNQGYPALQTPGRSSGPELDYVFGDDIDTQDDFSTGLDGASDGSRISQYRNDASNPPSAGTGSHRNTTYSHNTSEDDLESIYVQLAETPGPESIRNQHWSENYSRAGPSDQPLAIRPLRPSVRLPHDSSTTDRPYLLHGSSEDPSPSSAGATFFQEDDSPIDASRPQHSETGHLAGEFKSVRLSTGVTISAEAYKSLQALLDFYEVNDVTEDVAGEVQEQVRQSISADVAAQGTWSSKPEAIAFLQSVIRDVDEAVCHDSQTLVWSERGRRSHNTTAGEEEYEHDGSGGTAIILEPQRYSREGVSRAPWEQQQRQEQQLFEEERRRERAMEDHVIDSQWRTSPDHVSAAQLGYAAQSRRANNRQDSNNDNQLPEIPATGGGLGLAIKVTAPDEPLRVPINSPPSIPGRRMPPVVDGAMYSPATPSIYSRESQAANFSVIAMDPGHALGQGSKQDLSIPGDYALPSEGEAPSPSKSPSKSFRSAASDRPSTSSEEKRSPAYYTPVVTIDKETPEGKRLLKRRNLMRELYDTEDSYHQDLVIMVEIYRDSAEMVMTAEDKKALFANCEYVRRFSADMKDAIKRAIEPVYVPKASNKIWGQNENDIAEGNPEVMHLDPERDRKTRVGHFMDRSLNQMESVYGEYIKNHGRANERLLQLTTGKESGPKMKTWMDVCIEQSNDLTRAWNLDALLVKPTQRILKYPLILAGLVECTNPDHPDYDKLKQVQKQIIEISTRINENTKREELMTQVNLKYQKARDKPNMSTAFGRALGRRKEVLRDQVGLGTTVDDPVYDGIAQKFGGHFFQLQIVMRDVEKHMAELQTYMDTACAFVNTVTDWAAVGHLGDVPRVTHPELESKWRKYAQVYKEIALVALPEHKAVVQKSVIKPIQQLWKLHDNPQVMMYRRKKKMGDYLRYKALKDKGEKMDKKTIESGEQWLALSDTLKLELPKLYNLTKKLIESVLKNLIDIQITWQVIWHKKLKTAIYDVRPTGDFNQDLINLEKEFKTDYNLMPSEANKLAICNRTLVNEIPNYLSPIPGITTDDFDTGRRTGSRTQSMSSDKSVNSIIWSPPIVPGTQPHHTSQAANDRVAAHSGRYQPSSSATQLPHYPPQLDGSGELSARARYRSSTGQSSGSNTPRLSLMEATIFPSSRPSTSTARSDPSLLLQGRQSLETGDYRPPTGSTYDTANRSSNGRSSSIFSSAMPMSDSPALTRADSPDSSDSKDPDVLFLAASLFEFNIAHDRREGGYPYLVYVPGEVFDVLGTKGELWLARNQDDASKKIGWIWEKHFARILPETI
ncbi:hypothetical protein EJ05DRAFT_57030 [Pseudovirgaria hyperparasitica]|uniref:DH domain-containing protein n=1 Tax=Pseudovirgaria hyperparasitica TaxID=470096 RepID=A0A6A6W4Q2_9PEZI|nr:uncharacterized protein EJ05DRAFT_57030 [Pseudovirgaria hyperparasitica]KAF2757149.1 hypothetical protein EJ05DRAFT_57030 [Pseudovirgaria hyperparasitica]